jgi:hypothetical protein
MWGNTFDRFASGIGDATAAAIVEGQNFSDTMKTFARSAVQEVISGLVQIGIKQLALFALEKTMLAASTQANAAAASIQGGAAATSWAPAAAFASLATGGANSIPAGAALTGTVALAEGLAGLSSFDGGGYTGNGPRVGGLDGKGGRLAMIHPQEFITDFTKGQSAGSNVTMNFAPVIQGRDDVMEQLERQQKRFGRMVQRVVNKPY